MATTKNRLAELAFRHLTNDLSEKDNLELNQLIQDPANHKLFEDLTDRRRIEAAVKRMQQADVHMHASWQQIKAAYHFHNKSVAWKKYLAAAAVILPLTGVVAWYFYLRPTQQISPAVEPGPAITQYASYTPRSQRAVWKRAASLAVYLDELKNGVVGYSDGRPVTKNDSELVYSAAPRSNIPLPDTVQTLRGGYYRLRLPDGSKVVLNSASSVFFASAFGSNERQVSVNGEAWFEVVKDPARPFYVQVPGLKIEVRGTRFNVQAYKEDNIVRTSLLEGYVTVTAGKQVVFLKPGEQAVLTKKKKLEKITDLSAIKKATAWKSGTFIFENDDIRSIIAQLCRHYDLDVEYRGTIPDKTFYGVFYHNDPVELILGYLHDRSGIKFTKEGKKIIVRS
ncbi:MAG: FecR family protein [Niastella sp.]|uniref:FecR family protein n=1 Tax=Niastella sp. TaxID=1869183 RepID=UPI00389B09E6